MGPKRFTKASGSYVVRTRSTVVPVVPIYQLQGGTSSSRPQPLRAIGDIPDPAHEKYGRDAVLPRRALGLMLIRRGLPPSFVANASDEWSSANDDSIITTKRNNDINTNTAI